MKQTINLGAYGWLHEPWLSSFYPEELPEDWRLGYYSNEFNTVLVPADYWQNIEIGDCEDWLEDVHPDFQFYIECSSNLFDIVSLPDLMQALKLLKPQLSALVSLDEHAMPDSVMSRYDRLVDALELDVIGAGFGAEVREVWRPGCRPSKRSGLRQSSGFAFIEDELTDLRAARALIEPFTELLNDDAADTMEAAMIVHHPQLQAVNLAKFRAVLEIMGH